MSVSPTDLEMDDLREMFDIPDSPRTENSPDFVSLLAIPDSPTSSPIPSNNPSPITTPRIVRSDASLGLGTLPSPSMDSASVFDIPESRPSTPICYTNSSFDIPASRPSTPMLVDDQDISSSHTSPISSFSTEGREPSEPALVTAQPSHPQPPHPQPPPINGRNLIPLLPIITSRAALMRLALLERRAEAAYISSRIDSVVQDMAELQRQMDTMDALRIIRAAERQRSS